MLYSVFSTNKRVIVAAVGLNYSKTIISEIVSDSLINIFKNTNKCARINSILMDENVWIATYDGVLHFDNKGNLLHHFLKGKIVGRVIKDNEGSYWICTPSDGIFMIPSLKMNLLNSDLQIKKLTHDDVNHIYFNILPYLKNGVNIHIHDIFFPLEYPSQWILKETEIQTKTIKQR